MIWIIVIALVGFFLFRFFLDFNKDNDDLKNQSLNKKFAVIITALNKEAYNGSGIVTIVDKRSFNLYAKGSNQIINFQYGTGHLTITWKYKYFQKEVVEEKQFNNVRNLSVFEQQSIAETMIEIMKTIILKHKKHVLPTQKINFNELEIIDIEGVNTFFRKENNSLYTGMFFDHFDNGQLKTEGFLKDGKADGIYKQYFTDGNLISETHLKNGLKHGSDKEWYVDGSLYTESSYFEDKLNGIFREWYQNGNLKEELNFTMGKANGIHKEWYDNGQKKSEQNYKDGIKDGLGPIFLKK